MLLKYWLPCLEKWRPLFAQERTFQRALTLEAGLLGALGRRTVTAALGFFGKTQQDWSADYRFFSQAKWDSEPLFDPLLDQAVREYLPAHLPIATGLDDTSLPRTGKKIRTAFWQRDPMSPPFHPNLRWGQRFLQASLLLPLYRQEPTSAARALPIRFAECPVVRKPGKRAKPEVWQAYKQAKKLQFVGALGPGSHPVAPAARSVGIRRAATVGRGRRVFLQPHGLRGPVRRDRPLMPRQKEFTVM